MQQVETMTAVPVNVFAAKLTGFIIEQHPERIEETEFINQRGIQAALVFEQCSRAGMTVGDSLYEAEKTLYAGLIFSPFQTVIDVLVNSLHFNENDEELYPFAMQMLEYNKPLMERYDIQDDAFGGSYQFCMFYKEMKDNINLYITEHGLQ